VGPAIPQHLTFREYDFMFSFFARNWRKIQTAVKIIAFVLTVIIEAISSVGQYTEREINTAQ
jgi:hypothetical protein